MADPITIISLISAIVSLIDYGTKVGKRLKEYTSGLKKIPEAFIDISIQLPLVLRNLDRIKERLRHQNITSQIADTVSDVATQCEKHVKALNAILDNILPVFGDTPWRKGKKALLSVRQDEKIRYIANNLQSYTIYLTHHAVLDLQHQNRDVPITFKPFTMVPFARDPKFVGRIAILAKLADSLPYTATGTHRRVALVGLGGVGKSQIAVEYSYIMRESRPEIWVFWIHCSTEPRFKQSYEDIARALQLPAIDRTDVNVMQSVVDWLKQESNGQWLLILDNADNLDMFNIVNNGSSNRLLDYVPQSPHGRILITSKNKRAAFGLTNDESSLLNVERMNPAEALELLQSSLPHDRSPDKEKAELVRELDLLPLAIKQAAAYVSMSSARISISKYLEYLRDDRYQRAIELSRDGGDDRNNDNRQGILQPEVMPENDLEIDEALSCLEQFSLINFNIETQSYSMHRLVQLTTRCCLASEDTLLKWRHFALDILCRQFPEEEFRNWGTCQSLYPHAQTLLACEPTPSCWPFLAVLLIKVGQYDNARARYIEAGDKFRRAAEMAAHATGWDFPIALAANHRMATILRRMGRYSEAEGYGVLALKGYEANFGLAADETLEVVRTLTTIYRSQGNYHMAEELHERILRCRPELQLRSYLIPGRGIVDATQFAVGQQQVARSSAVKLSEEVVELRKAKLGSQHPDTLAAINELAEAYEAQGSFEDALSKHAEALEGRSILFGLVHPMTLNSMSYYAEMVMHLKKQEEAAVLHRKVLEARKAVLGPEHPLTLDSISYLAKALASRGHYEESVQLTRLAMERKQVILGLDHPRTLDSVHELAEVLVIRDFQNNFDEAEKLYTRATEGRRKTLGAEHPDTIHSKYALDRIHMIKSGAQP